MTHDYTAFEDQIPSGFLEQLPALAAAQRRAEAEVLRLEGLLKEAQAVFADIAEHKIPDLLEAAGLQEFRTTGGLVVSISTDIRASITKEREQACFSWLEANGQGGIIKREFKIEFGREEEGWANRFEADLNRRKRPVRVKRKKFVHPQTLEALVREKLRDGDDIPQELFGVYRQRRAKIVSKC